MRRRVALLIAGIGFVAAVVGVRMQFGALDAPQAARALSEVAATWWAIPAYVLAFLVGSGLLAPAIAFFAAAGAAWGFGEGLAVGLFAVNLAANFQFGVGRWLGGDTVRRVLERRGWSWLLAELSGRGALSVVIVRQLPLPFLGVNVAAGASPVRWPAFLVGNALGVLPNALVYTYFASVLVDGAKGGREVVLRAALAAGAALLLALATRAVSARWRPRQADAQATTPR